MPPPPRPQSACPANIVFRPSSSTPSSFQETLRSTFRDDQPDLDSAPLQVSPLIQPSSKPRFAEEPQIYPETRFPPREDKRPVKSILKQPKPQFPEEPNPVREGVAPLKDDKNKADVPPGARWTQINRSLVNPQALTIGKERFEVRDDVVVVLRVLSKEEVQAYANATANLRSTF